VIDASFEHWPASSALFFRPSQDGKHLSFTFPHASASSLAAFDSGSRHCLATTTGPPPKYSRSHALHSHKSYLCDLTPTGVKGEPCCSCRRMVNSLTLGSAQISCHLRLSILYLSSPLERR
jgi:hypothetical protein